MTRAARVNIGDSHSETICHSNCFIWILQAEQLRRVVCAQGSSAKADSKNVEPEKEAITSGLAVLPDELLLEVVPYLPSPPEPFEKHALKMYGIRGTARALPCLDNDLPTSSAIFSPLHMEKA